MTSRVNIFMRKGTKLSEQAVRGRGRPRKFDPDKALRAATAVFQKKGYDAASLDDLSAATGLARPSLYSAFGNKEALYLSVLKAVVKDMESTLLSAIDADLPLEASLRGFYRAAIDRYTVGPAGGCGCILMTTAVMRAVESEAVQSYLARTLADLDRVMGYLYKRKYDGPIETRKCKTLLAVSTLQTLSIQARAGSDRASLQARVETVLPSLI